MIEAGQKAIQRWQRRFRESSSAVVFVIVIIASTERKSVQRTQDTWSVERVIFLFHPSASFCSFSCATRRVYLSSCTIYRKMNVKRCIFVVRLLFPPFKGRTTLSLWPPSSMFPFVRVRVKPLFLCVHFRRTALYPRVPPLDDAFICLDSSILVVVCSAISYFLSVSRKEYDCSVTS